MLKNYFFTALRNILKHKIYSFINIVGLAVGITCTILILLYVTDELSYDRFHSKADRIYRVNEIIDPSEKSSSLPFPTSQALLTDFPNYIETSVRLFNFQASTLAMEYRSETGQLVQFNEPNVFLVDSTFFEVFDFKLAQGNPQNVLTKPLSILVTQSTAKKYFGDENPIDKIIRFDGMTDLTVTGILEDTPSNSHFKYDFLISLSSLPHFENLPRTDNNWLWNPCWTYIVLKEGIKPEDLEHLFPNFVKKYFHSSIVERTSLKLQPLTDIHLYSNLDYEIETNGDVTMVYIFGIIAVFILAIAGINFINLATARSMKRAREVGVRKVMGALPNQLIGQFLAESVLFSLFAIILAIPFVYTFLPGLNALAHKEIAFTFITNGYFWAALFLIVILVGLVGGIYPAMFLSSFQPVKVLAGKIGKIGSGALLRKLLVVAQFSISGILIIGTIITYNQLQHLRKVNLGFDKEQVIVLPIKRTQVIHQYAQFKERILKNKNVLQVSASNMLLGTETQTAGYSFVGKTNSIMLSTYYVETDFGKTSGLTFLAGRDFSTDYATDTADGGGGAIVNESFLKLTEWKTPEETINKSLVGTTIAGDIKIIGVVKDFHYTSLKLPIAPSLFVVQPNPSGRLFARSYIYIRLTPGNYESDISEIGKVFKEFVPSRPFDYFFLDERINSLYSAEDSLGKVATVFSIMAIFVACLSLFGLSSFTAEQRTKEIGIRKVVGASVGTIVMLLSKQFLILVAVANLIAWPASYYIMNLWLSNFQTQIEIDIIPFITAAVFTFLIAFATMSFQAIKAAQSDPVKSLKYE